MAYHIDADNVSLDELQRRIAETDLVPSRSSLLNGITAKFKALEQKGIATLAILRGELKNTKHLEAVSSVTGVDKQYLVLLRREIESYFPKPRVLKDFNWLPIEEITKIEKNGMPNTAVLYNTLHNANNVYEFAKSIDVDVIIIEELLRLADLTRIQWVNPTAARMLMEAGYSSVTQVATADAEELCKALSVVNAEGRFFKGQIGLRDIKRLIRAANYVGGK
jgi:hypothetical protein